MMFIQYDKMQNVTYTQMLMGVLLSVLHLAENSKKKTNDQVSKSL